jgi:dUTP pyrophosphatase
MNYTIEDFTKDMYLIPGMEEFCDLLNTPNSIFDTIYPAIREEIIAQFSDPSIVNMKNLISNSEEYLLITEKLPEIISNFKTIEGVSQNKVDFLTLLLETFIGEPFDAEVPIEILENGTIPTYTHITDAGADVYAKEDIIILPDTYGLQIPIGIKVALPAGWELDVRPRSGMSRDTSLRISNAPGTIDAGHRGEIGVLIDNIGTKEVRISKGDRIAQLVLQRSYRAKWKEVNSVKDIGEDRGGGFGHSGK